ncbi:SusC/RagA family TonB-linked outer membrane protein [Cytophagaceae bacterium BD1B2-1]|uniref:SusC/RagA family TonB-linked outer membrane protein n=2 Tax=Xanthocytophaga agilis TaxID=3048010 RepID=A0AAE3R4L2_9BACT|nr:SusC/RagA family TonB-linked outer membrane protein [Xanthocytophaga agilis]
MKNKRHLCDSVLKIMQISILHVFTIVAFAGIALASEGQGQNLLDRRITMNSQNEKMEKILDQLEQVAGVRFLYSPELIQADRKVTVKARNEKLMDVLDHMLTPLQLSYRLSGQQIIIKPVEEGGSSESRSAIEENNESVAVTISGTVTETDKGDPLPGVSVSVKGSTTGTVTNADGKYTLNVADGNVTLVFSFIGYLTEEVAAGGRTTVDISLSPDITSLNEVVVVGYGTQEKRELTSSVVTVTSKNFVPGAFNSPLQMIDGKVPGVVLSTPAAADPNASPDIQVRGASSLEAGNGPLIIIDGMPGGNLRNIAQQDIESITVLKDGGAAAIYGSRGANGVILVTTKRGKAGKVSVSYDSFIDHDVVAVKPDILSPEEFIEKGRDQDRGARTNWYDALIRKNNFGQNHSLSIGGGSENSVFRISGNYRTKSGIDIASDRKEYGIRANFQQKALDNLLEINGNFSYRVANEEYTKYEVFQQAIKLNPTLPIMDPDNPTRFGQVFGYDTFNPVQDLKTRENGADQTYSIVDFTAILKPFKSFNTQLKLARQSQDEDKREYYNSQSKESIDNNRTGRARLQNQKWTDWTLEWTGNYFANFGLHDIKVLGGYSYQEFNRKLFWAENANFPSDAFGYNNLDAGKWNLVDGRLGMDSERSKEKVIAFFGRVNYDFNDTYLFSGTLRYEGNTKFGANNKWGLFPAASAAWRLSKLPLFQSVPVINDLKLRASYGVTGRSGFPRYSALAKYTGFGRWQNDEGEWIQVYGPANNPNYNLRWERQNSYNLGLDFTLFNNRLSGNLDLFVRKATDVISNYDAPVPPYLHDQIFTNVASTSAKGIELGITWNAVKTDNFNYTTNLTAFYIKSKLDKFSNGTFNKGFMDRFNLPSPGNPGPAQRLEDNTEVGSFYGYKYAGVDENGNILIWKGGTPGTEAILASAGSSTDKTYLGHGAPHYELTWGNTLSYKGFDLTLYFRGRFDYKILNLYQMYYGLVAEPGVNLLKDAYERNGDIKSGKVMTDYFLEKGDFFKLDNLTLGWSPKIQNKYLSQFRIYATVRNVFTLTKYTGLDPTSVQIAGLEPGIGSLNVYPVTRNFSLGAQITF